MLYNNEKDFQYERMVNMGKERNTRQKEAIIKFLKENECKHLSISDIKSVLGNEIGLTTIYRIII